MNDLHESIKKCKIQGNTLYLPPVNEGLLSNYAELRTALLNAGAKYKKNTFVFSSDAQPFIDRLLGGEKVNIKKEFQFFGTPDKLADRLVGFADIQQLDTVLEPSAGQGAIVKAIHRAIHMFSVFGYELMQENRDILNRLDGFTLLGNDFINSRKEISVDKIIANPPFSKNQDIDHIKKMYECLNEGGRIVTIASKHWQISVRKKETEFRKWLKDLDAKIYEVSAGEFKESGTSIATCIIIIDRK